MTALGMRVAGIPDVRKALQELSASQSKAVVQRAMVKAAQPMAEKAAQNAEQTTATGKLVAAIGTYRRTAKSQRKSGVKVGKETAAAYVGVGYRRGSRGYAPHAHLIEHGTAPRWHESGKYVGQVQPQPFMRRAFDSDKDGYIDRFASATLAEIERTTKRLARKRAKGFAARYSARKGR